MNKVLKSLGMIFNIAKTELKILFYSPIAWLIIIAFVVQATIPFIEQLSTLVRYKSLGYTYSLQNETFKLFLGKDSISVEVLSHLYLFIPLLTMGLMSREINTGSIKLLFSSPISAKQIVFGKFFAMMIFGVILIIPILVLVLFSYFIVPNLDVSLIFTGILGVYLLICAYSAIGIFMSSLTSYQVVAAIGTFAVLGFLNFIGDVGQGIDFVRDITYWLSMTGRAKGFVKGLISSDAILYFILVIGMFLTFTIIRFQGSRVKTRAAIIASYVFTVVAGLLIGYISSRPTMKHYADMTATKHNTLTKASQDIIKQLEGDLEINTYVNLLDYSRGYGMFDQINIDKARLEKYVRFKPEIKLNYIYYWDKNLGGGSFYRQYKGMTDEQVAKRICDCCDWDYDKFLTSEQIRSKINLRTEGNRFVRQIVSSNGNKAWLRIYNDMSKFPGEQEVSAALKRLITKVPKVGFLVGHGERSVHEETGRGFYNTTIDQKGRFALINQGFDCIEVDLSKDNIADDVSILVISDMKKDLSDKEYKILEKYIDRGGNLFIIAEPKRVKAMKKLVGLFGVKFSNGIIVQKNKGHLASLVTPRVTLEASKNISYRFAGMYKYSKTVSMLGAIGLDCTGCNNKGFKATPIFKTYKKDTWNELETTDFVDDTVSINTQIGEVRNIYTMGTALTRNINNKEQRIMIIGDADWMSNEGLHKSYKKVKSLNSTALMGIYHWLSESKMPIDTRRELKKDKGLKLSKSQFSVWKVIFLWVIPFMLIAAYVLIYLRRFKK